MKFNSQNIGETLEKEWLVTNGIGGYASSTIAGANTRRYHGLLIAALHPPVQRQLLVSKIEEAIVFRDGSNTALSSNFFPGVIHPEGFKNIDSFERAPLPSLVYTVGDQRVRKTVFMVDEANATVVEYENLGTEVSELSLNPFYVYRDYHSLYREDDFFCHFFNMDGRMLEIMTCHDGAPLYTAWSKGKFKELFDWYRNFEFPEDQMRGQDYREDAFSIGSIHVTLSPGEKFFFTFSLVRRIAETDPETLKEQELKRIRKLIPKFTNDQFLKDLMVSADQFIVARASTKSKSVIAGYHWFTDWGRDTMIAMQGLTISSGKKAASRSILKTFMQHIDEDMIPNRFPDSEDDRLEYNTMDATLWLFIALYKYYKRFNDGDFIAKNIHYLEDILKAHIHGTRYNIHVTEEGFLYGGEGIQQLTWMDARVGDHVVTPRHGMPVEIQALWYNALQVYLFFSREFPKHDFSLAPRVKMYSKNIRTNFRLHFLNGEGYLSDLLNKDLTVDSSLRPNQIYALSLPFPLIDRKRGKSILEQIEMHLLTPYGLRSLASDHPDFRPEYSGNPWDRDTAYHQGTVWVFLLSEYYLACQYVYGRSDTAFHKVEGSLKALRDHFYHADCIHGVSEIFDGLQPDKGKGAVHQAWSVSALIQILMDKVKETNH